MANRNLIMTLAKVIIAAAWADGEINNDEINSLKDLLFRIPELTIQQWAELDIYIETPVSAEERNRLVEDLQAAIFSNGDKQLAINTLQEVIEADGQITEDERQVFAEIRNAIENADTGIVGALSGLMRSPLQRRSSAANAYNRERYMEDFIKNKVFYGIRRRLDLGEAKLNIPEADLRKLSLAGGLLGLVAHASDGIDKKEFDTIHDALKKTWNTTDEAAALVAEVATDPTSANLDYLRTAREFFGLCTRDELLTFIDLLFEVAVADGMVSNAEIEQIRAISRSLLLSHEEFIQAKLKIPREKRQS